MVVTISAVVAGVLLSVSTSIMDFWMLLDTLKLNTSMYPQTILFYVPLIIQSEAALVVLLSCAPGLMSAAVR